MTMWSVHDVFSYCSIGSFFFSLVHYLIYDTRFLLQAHNMNKHFHAADAVFRLRCIWFDLFTRTDMLLAYIFWTIIFPIPSQPFNVDLFPQKECDSMMHMWGCVYVFCVNVCWTVQMWKYRTIKYNTGEKKMVRLVIATVWKCFEF